MPNLTYRIAYVPNDAVGDFVRVDVMDGLAIVDNVSFPAAGLSSPDIHMKAQAFLASNDARRLVEAERQQARETQRTAIKASLASVLEKEFELVSGVPREVISPVPPASTRTPTEPITPIL